MDAVNSVALRLPFEMQHNIALLCERSDLAHLARIHSAWTSACESVLYRTIALGSVSVFARRVNELFCTLALHPEKASLVYSFSITGVSPPMIGEVESRTRGAFSAAYLNALPQMINLRHLTVPILFAYGGLDDAFCRSVLHLLVTATFRLEGLIFPAFSDEYLKGSDQRFLATLDAAIRPHSGTLKSLGLAYRQTPSVTGGDLQRLSDFASRFSVFAIGANTSLLSDIYLCPVPASISMWDSEVYARDIKQAIRADSADELRFTVTAVRQMYAIVPDILRRLLAVFPRIVALTFRLFEPAESNIDDGTTSLYAACDAIIGALAPFNPHLIDLTFALAWRNQEDGSRPILPVLAKHEELGLLRQVGIRCQSLRRVTLPYDTTYECAAHGDGWSMVYDEDDWEDYRDDPDGYYFGVSD